MSPASFVLTALPIVLMLAFVGLSLRRLQRVHRDHVELLASGVPAVGIVRSLEPRFPRRIAFELGLEVTLAGRPTTYTTKSLQLLGEHRVGSVQPGMSVHLRVDPEDRARLVVTDSPGETVEALYRDADDGGEGRRSPSPATPLYDPKRMSAFFPLMYGLLAFGALPFVGLAFVVNWASLSPPAGGFCAAAARCCEVAPPIVFPSLAAMPGYEPPAKDCTATAGDDERSCQMSYDFYKKRAEKAGLRCE